MQFILVVGEEPAEIIPFHDLPGVFREYAAEAIRLWYQVKDRLVEVDFVSEFISADDRFYYYDTTLTWEGSDPERPVIVQWDHRKF